MNNEETLGTDVPEAPLGEEVTSEQGIPASPAYADPASADNQAGQSQVTPVGAEGDSTHLFNFHGPKKDRTGKPIMGKTNDGRDYIEMDNDSLLFRDGHVEKQWGGKVLASADPYHHPLDVTPHAAAPVVDLEQVARKKAAEKGLMYPEKGTPEEIAAYNKARAPLLGYYAPSTDIGEAALANETPSTAARIESIVAGQTPPPPTSRSNPLNAHLWDLIYARDPNYTPQSFATFKNFTSGKDSESLASMQAALEHLVNFRDSVEKLDPAKFRAVNSIGNLLKTNTDDPDLMRVKADAQALKAQLAGFYKGQGRAPTDPEMTSWEGIFDAANGPQQSKAAVGETVRLMQGQYHAIKDKFLRTTGATDTSFKFLSPRTHKLMQDKFNTDFDAPSESGGGDPATAGGAQPATSSAAPVSQAPPTAPPVPSHDAAFQEAKRVLADPNSKPGERSQAESVLASMRTLGLIHE